MLKKIRIDILTDAGDTIQHEVKELPRYEVKDIEGFFGVYGFTDDEKSEIRERFSDEGLTVFSDGSAVWDGGEELVGGSDEVIADDDFREEARRAGAEVVRV